jgi:hypothetical protein
MGNIVVKEFNDFKITFEGKDMVSLTDTWKASGENSSKDPRHWLESEPNQKFINTVAKSLNVGINGILKTSRGKGGGTKAHWQIWLAYAKYLSPELHMWANQIVKERIEEEKNPELAYSRGRERAIKGWKKQGRTDEWIAKRLRAIDATKTDNKILAKHGDDGRVFSMCADALNVGIIGMKAKEFKAMNNAPEKAATRDYMDEIQLAEIALASVVSCKRIETDNIRGNNSCANVHQVIAERISNAVNMRGI